MIKNPTTAAAKTPLDKVLLFVCLFPPGSDLSGKYGQNSHVISCISRSLCKECTIMESAIATVQICVARAWHWSKESGNPEFLFASVSKQVLAQSVSYEREFDLQSESESANETNLRQNGFAGKIVLTQAKGNVETAYVLGGSWAVIIIL